MSCRCLAKFTMCRFKDSCCVLCLCFFLLHVLLMYTNATVTEGYYEVTTGDMVNTVSRTLSVSSLKKCTLACNQLMALQSACTMATFDTLTLKCHVSSGWPNETTSGHGENYKTVRPRQYCPVFPDVTNGNFTGPVFPALGDTAELTCNYGYMPGNGTIVTCTKSGWQPTNLTCIIDPDINYTPTHGYSGTRFWTAFLGDGSFTPYLYIVSPTSTQMNIQIPSMYVNETSQINPGTSIRPFSTTLGPQLGGGTSELANKGVLVITNHPVYFYSAVVKAGQTGGTLVYPESSLGTKYMIMGHSSTLNAPEMFAVVATGGSTKVDITLPSGVTETLTLGQWDTYVRQEASLSGTIISASARVAVVSGHTCAYIPVAEDGSCDYIDASMPPIQAYGQNFVVGYMRPRPEFSVGVTAPNNYTSVTFYTSDGAEITTVPLSQGQVYTKAFYYSNTISVVSNKPILVVQYGHTQTEDSLTGDPSMMVVPALQNYGSEYHFQALTGYNDPAGLTVVIRDGTETGILLDNAAASYVAISSVMVPGKGLYQVLHFTVYSGYHNLTHTNSEPFGAWLYARSNNQEEYAMCLGMLT